MFKEKHPINPCAKDFTLEAHGKRAALLIHGFTSSPYHFHDYAAFLQKKDIYVRAMRLPGHGSHPEDLLRSSYLDWRQAVHDELLELKRIKEKVYIFGYSFGANLAFDAAMHYPDLVNGIVATSPAIKLRHDLVLRVLARFYDRYTSFKFRPSPGTRNLPPETIKNIQERGGYTKMPIKSALEFFHFIDNFTKPHLKDVKAPCLILQPDNDPLNTPKSAKYVYEHLGSKDKKLVIINSRDHILVSDEALQQSYREAAEFLKNH